MAECGANNQLIQPLSNKFKSGVADYISYSLQSDPSDESNKKLFEILSGAGAEDFTKYLFANHLYSIVFWSFGLFLIVSSLLLFLITAFWQCCSTCRPKKSKKAKKSGIILIILSTIALVSILYGFCQFHSAEGKTDFAIRDFGYDERLVMKDTEQFILNGLDELKCEVNDLFNETSKQSKIAIPKIIDGIKKESNLDELLEFADKIEIIEFPESPTTLSDICPDVYDKMKNTADNINAQMRSVTKKLAETNVETAKLQSQTMKNIDSMIEKQKKDVMGALNIESQVRGQFQHIQAEFERYYNKAVTGDKYYTTKKSIRTIYETAILITLFFVLLAIGSLVMFSKSKDGTCSHFLIIVGFYITLIVTVVILLMFNVSFVGGWAVTTACVSNFRNVDHTLLNNFEKEIELAGVRKTLNAGHILSACRSSKKTIFSFIDVSNMIPSTFVDPSLIKTIEDKIKLLAKPSDIEQLSKSLEQAKANEKGNKEIIKSCSTAEQIAHVDKMKHQVETIVQLAKNIDVNIDVNSITTNKLVDVKVTIDTFIRRLDTEIVPCRPLFNIYQKLETAVCHNLGTPINDLWFSLGITGLSTFFAAILLLLSYRWLNSGKSSRVSLNGVE